MKTKKQNGKSEALPALAPGTLLDDKCQTEIKELIHKRSLACEELTLNQLAVVIRQALASGDLIKLVRVTDSAQNVIYIPYAEANRLRIRVRYLEELLKQNGIEEPETCDVSSNDQAEAQPPRRETI